MNLIKKIDIKGLRNAEYIQFMMDISSAITNRPACLLLLSKYHTELQIQCRQVEIRTFRSKRSDFTSQMQEMDQQRDRLYIGFCSIVKGYTYSITENEKTAADLLESSLGRFGSRMDKNNYHAETADISKIVSDFTTQPELIAAVALLQLTNWIVQLGSANKEFRERYMDRIQEGVAAPEGNVKETRKKCNEIYYKLRDEMDAYIILKNEEVIAVSRTVNELIRQYMGIPHLRRNP